MTISTITPVRDANVAEIRYFRHGTIVTPTGKLSTSYRDACG